MVIVISIKIHYNNQISSGALNKNLTNFVKIFTTHIHQTFPNSFHIQNFIVITIAFLNNAYVCMYVCMGIHIIYIVYLIVCGN